MANTPLGQPGDITWRFGYNYPQKETRMAMLHSAVVGVGFIGPVHVEALRRLNRPIAGVLGSSAEKSRLAAGQLGLSRGYANFDELLADASVGVVHLTSPNRLHFEQCRRVLTPPTRRNSRR